MAINVNTLSAPWGRRRVGSEAKTYNRMRLACSRKRGEVKSKRGPMIIEPWPDFDNNLWKFIVDKSSSGLIDRLRTIETRSSLSICII